MDGHGLQEPAERCQARPKAARAGYREDMLCASMAHASVDYHGTSVPVCRIHVATYARWADEAEANAQNQWAWFYDKDTPLGI